MRDIKQTSLIGKTCAQIKHNRFWKYFYLTLNLSRKELSFSGGNLIYRSMIQHFFGREQLTVLPRRVVAITPGSGFYSFADTDSQTQKLYEPETQAPVTDQIP